MMAHRILIVEDEQELADILAAYLKVEGYEVETAFDGEEGLRIAKEKSIDLALLDIMLPKVDGMEVCRTIRQQSEMPIIMISAKNGELDKVVALGTGADDYVTKPFSPLELVARCKAQLRRYERMTGQVGKEEHLDQVLRFDELVLDKNAYQVSVLNQEVEFTTKEFDVLYYLAQSPGQVFTKEQIYQGVWGYEGICDENSVAVYIKRIREKLNKYKITCIHTVWGIGYKFHKEAL